MAKLTRNERGATSIEYAAVASLISIVAVAAFGSIANAVAALFASVPAF